MTRARTTLLFNPYLTTLGGGERFIYALASYFRSIGDSVIIAAPALPDSTALARFGFDTSLELVQVGEDEITEYSRGYDQLVYLTNHFPRRSGAKESYLVVQFPFDQLPHKANEEWWHFHNLTLREYRCVVYSSYVQKWLRMRWRTSSEILPPLVEMGSAEASGKEKSILSVGRFFYGGHSKRQDILIEAFRQLPARVQDAWHLHLVGGCKSDDESLAYVERLETMARGYNISVEVNASQSRVVELYRKARLFWHGTGYGRGEGEPEKAEHFGITTVEAMSFACVPLVYEDGGQVEIVSSDVGRLWRTVDELSAMTTELADDVDVQQRLSSNAVVAAQAYAPERFEAACQRVFVRKPRVATIILGYKSRDYVAASIESVLASRFHSRVLFVDNDSGDGSDEYIREKFEGPDVEILQTGSNLGYAGGNNAGIVEVMKWNPEYILILNPDTVLDENCIGALVDQMENVPAAALASPKIYFAGGAKRIWYAGSVMDWDTGTSGHIGYGETDDGSHDRLGPTARACGAAMLIRTSAIAEVGVMDERYFLYFEEVDWSERFKLAGHEVLFVPTAVCHHAVGSSTGTDDSPLYRYYMTRNNLLFMSKFGGAHQGAFRRFILKDAMRRVNGWLQHPNKRNYDRVRATLKGFVDFGFKRFGPRWH